MLQLNLIPSLRNVFIKKVENRYSHLLKLKNTVGLVLFWFPTWSKLALSGRTLFDSSFVKNVYHLKVSNLCCELLIPFSNYILLFFKWPTLSGSFLSQETHLSFFAKSSLQPSLKLSGCNLPKIHTYKVFFKS